MHPQRLLFGGFVLDPARGALLRDGAPVAIGHRAMALLAALAKAGGRVLTKAELIDAAWPSAVVEEKSNLSVQVAALRKLLGSTPDGGEAIATVARVGYRFCLPVEIAQSKDGDDPQHAAVADARPSVAVLPLVNLAVDPDQEYFADGVTEDIIMALSRFRWFRVVGRGSSFAFKHRRVSTPEVAARLAVRYVLEGSVRKFAGQLRIALQLTEAAGGSELWGEHYNFAQADIFAMQDSIAHQVAGAVEPELLKTASAEAVASRPAADASVQDLDLVYRGVWLFHRVDRASHLKARDLFRQACRRSPELGAAQFWLARVNAGVVAYGWSASEPADLREGIAAATQAIRADEKSPYAHYALAITSVFASEFEQAMRAAQRAIELAPGFALGHLVLGMARLYSGDAAGALAPLSHGLQLNRFDPQNFVWYNTLAYAHLFSGDPAGALAASRRRRRSARIGLPPSNRRCAPSGPKATSLQPRDARIS
jgi:TolB-like protein